MDLSKNNFSVFLNLDSKNESNINESINNIDILKNTFNILKNNK